MAGIQIPQTDYGQTPTAFAAGMPARPLGNGETVEHFVASVDIDPMIKDLHGQFQENK